MEDAVTAPEPGEAGTPESSGPQAMNVFAATQRLEIVSRKQNRAPRPVTNLARVFGQFAEVQQHVAQQVIALEGTVEQEREVLTETVNQLPELRGKIDWLMATFCEQGQKNAAIQDRLNRQEEEIAHLKATVRWLIEERRDWERTLDPLAGVPPAANGGVMSRK